MFLVYIAIWYQITQFIFKIHHIWAYLVDGDFRINLSRSDISVSQNAAHSLYGYSFINGQDGKAVSGAMHRGDDPSSPFYIHDVRQTKFTDVNKR